MLGIKAEGFSKIISLICDNILSNFCTKELIDLSFSYV